MAFPTRLLRDGEDLVLDLRPHPIALAFPLGVTVLVLVAMGLILNYLPDSSPTWARWATVIVAVGVILVLAAPRVIRWATSHFVVTSERIIHRTGLVAKHSMDIPLDRLQNVQFGQSVFERMIGAGNLALESAGEDGMTTFDDVRHPDRVQKTIYEVREQDEQKRIRPVVQAAAAAGSSGSVADELAKLESLRQQGVLSDAEFQAQKARLLGS